MNFGKWIFISFILFAGLMAILTVLSLRQSIPLVSHEYYKEDLQYQSEYNQLQNATKLSHQPTIQFGNSRLVIGYGKLNSITSGTVSLMRPSDPTLDHTFYFQNTHTNELVFEIPNAKPGLYKLRLQWSEGDVTYRIDKTIVV